MVSPMISVVADMTLVERAWLKIMTPTLVELMSRVLSVIPELVRLEVKLRVTFPETNGA